MTKNIVNTIDEIATYRPSEIFDLIKPILPLKSRTDGTVFIENTYKSQETIFFVSTYGKKEENYEDEKFQTIHSSYKATYYEVWAPVNARERYLHKAYFHLYKLLEVDDDIDDRDYVWVHCDPNEKDATHIPYKLTPHLHIMRHDEEMSHAHIGLHLYKAGELLHSRQSMTDAISSALEMISKQLIH